MPADSDFFDKVDNAEIEIRRDRFDGIQLTIVRGSMLKHLHLSRPQAATIVAGLIQVLGEPVWPSARSK